MKFSRGGVISVIRIPDQPWCRESSQDVHPRDTGLNGWFPCCFRKLEVS
jgi:hypothetical protein